MISGDAAPSRGFNPSVLMLANSLDIGGRHGGAERFAAELSLSLHEAGCPVTVALYMQVGSDVERAWEKRLQDAGVPVVYLCTQQRSGFLRAYQTAVSICRQQRIDIVHSHSKAGCLIAVCLRLLGHVKFALQTIHAGQEWGWGIQRWILRQIFSKWVFGLFLDAQVGVSQEIQQRTSASPGAKLSHKPVVYIPNVLADDWFDIPLRQSTPEQNKMVSPVIGMVGVLNPKKGPHILIDAVKLLSEAFPAARLWVIGEGPQRASLVAQAQKLGIQERVTFWGALEHGKVREMLDHMSILTLPSFSEGLPTVLLEGMARRIPVIASDIQGVRQLIEDGVTGWLVPPGSARHLADAMHRVLENPNEVSVVVQNAYRTAQQYRFSVVTPQYMQLYRNIYPSDRS